MAGTPFRLWLQILTYIVLPNVEKYKIEEKQTLSDFNNIASMFAKTTSRIFLQFFYLLSSSSVVCSYQVYRIECVSIFFLLMLIMFIPSHYVRPQEFPLLVYSQLYAHLKYLAIPST